MFLDKNFKKYHWYSFYHFTNSCFSWVSSIFAFEFVFSCMIFKNILLFFFVFTFFFEEYLGSFVLILLFLFKKILKKKSDSLNFSLVFLLTLFSLFWFVSLWCLLSLLLVFSFPTFFLFFCLPFFSFHISSPYVCLSLCLFTLSLVLPLLIPFFENSPLFFFFLKKTSFFICSSLFVKLFLFHLLCCFAPFPVCFCFFQSCSFEQDKLTFFSWQKNHLFNTSKNLFPEFLLIFSKGLSSFCFSNFSKFPFSKKKKKLFFWISEKIPHKNGFDKKWLSRSHCLEIFSCLEKIRLSSICRKMFLSSPSCVFRRSKNVFLKKSHSKKLFSWRKQNFFYLLLIFAPSLFWAKTLFYFSVSFYFFNCRAISFFFFFWSFFSGVCFSEQKNGVKKSFEKHIGFFPNIFFGTFFWRREHILIPKRMCSKIIIRIFLFLKKKSLLKEKILQDSHVLRIACANEGPLDHCCVSWRSRVSQVCVHSVVIDPGRGTSVASSHLSPFFFCFSFFLWKASFKKNVLLMSFFALLFFFQFFEHFSDFFASISLQNQNIHGRKFIFPLFIFLFYSHVSCPFFSPHGFVKGIWWQKTKHVTKRNEWSQWWEWSTKSEKEVFCWRVFQHDRRSELMDLNQPWRMPWLMIFG